MHIHMHIFEETLAIFKFNCILSSWPWLQGAYVMNHGNFLLHILYICVYSGYMCYVFLVVAVANAKIL